MKIATRKLTERANAELPKRMASARAGEGDKLGCRAAGCLLWSIVGFLLVLNWAVSVDPQTAPATNNLLTHTAGDGGPDPASTHFTYHADGTLATITDALGNVTSHTYDYAFSDPAFPGVVKQLTVTVTDPAGPPGSDPANPTPTVLRVTRTLSDVQENQLAQLALRTRGDGASETVVTRFVYDAEHRLTATIQPNGQVTETRYTSFGQTDRTLLWRSVADYQSGDPALARVTTLDYDTRGNLIATTTPDGLAETASFDLENRREWTQDRLGRRTHFQYDAVGRLRFTIYPDETPADLADNPRTETVYDLAGRVTDTYDELRHRTTVLYFPDGTPDAGRRRQSVQVLTTGNLATTFAYDAAGNLRFVTDPRGNTVETRYDTHARPVAVISPATDEHPATQATTTYNALGQRSATTDQEGKITRYRFDGLGRLVEVRQYLDAATAASDSDSSLPATHSSLLSTRYSFDELGNQTAQTDALDRVTRYEYDSLGRRTKRILPDGARETLQYDAWSNLWKRTDFQGHTTTFLYDVMNRLTEKRADPLHPSLIYSHAPDKITFGYDAAGNRTDATVEKGGAVLYAEDTPVDERNRRRFKDTVLGRLTYGYHANNLLQSITSSNTDGVRLGYRYDEANRLAFVDDAAGGGTRTTAYGYDANGSLATVALPNTVVHTYGYDSLNRLRTLNVARGATSLHRYEYKLKPSGHRQQVIENGARISTFAYDALYRLTNETLSGDTQGNNGTVAYTLDKVGNRLSRGSQISNLPSQIGVSYNARDWLSGDSYDANGNTTLSLGVTAQPDVYDFDAARQRGDGVVQQSETAPNSVRGECARVPSGRSHEQDRLILRRRPDGSSVSLGYDADGLRVRKTVFDSASLLVSATGYLIDANNPTGFAQVVEEYRNVAAGTTATVYAYGNDLISRSVLAPGSTLPALAYFVYDGLGSVRALTNASGAVTDTYDYDAFGVLLARTGTTANDYLYRGEQFDADLGLYYLRARYLNPASGRFWNQDTFEGSLADPASLHKYLYANGNPVTNFDPSGNFSLTELATTVTVASSLALIATPVVRPIVAQAVRTFSGDPSARFSLTSLGVFDESADLLDASGISLGEFSGNLFAEAFTQLGTDAVVGAAAAAGTVGVFKGFAAIRRIRANHGAAESRALTLGSQEAFDAALLQSATGSTEVVNGFRVFGNKGLVGDAFNRNIFLIEAKQKGATSLRGLLNAFEAEARSAGASQINIVGHSIANEGFMNPAILERFGFTFRQINNETIFLSKTIKP